MDGNGKNGSSTVSGNGHGGSHPAAPDASQLDQASMSVTPAPVHGDTMVPGPSEYSNFSPICAPERLPLDQVEIMAEATSARSDGRQRVEAHHTRAFWSLFARHLHPLQNMRSTLEELLVSRRRAMEKLNTILENTPPYVDINMDKKPWSPRSILTLFLYSAGFVLLSLLEIRLVGGVLASSGIDAFSGWSGYLMAGYALVPAIALEILLERTPSVEQRQRRVRWCAGAAMVLGIMFLVCFAITFAQLTGDPATRVASVMSGEGGITDWADGVAIVRQCCGTIGLTLGIAAILTSILSLLGSHRIRKRITNPAYTTVAQDFERARVLYTKDQDALGAAKGRLAEIESAMAVYVGRAGAAYELCAGQFRVQRQREEQLSRACDSLWLKPSSAPQLGTGSLQREFRRR